jgi:hypothetical protein
MTRRALPPLAPCVDRPHKRQKTAGGRARVASFVRIGHCTKREKRGKGPMSPPENRQPPPSQTTLTRPDADPRNPLSSLSSSPFYSRRSNYNPLSLLFSTQSKLPGPQLRIERSTTLDFPYRARSTYRQPTHTNPQAPPTTHTHTRSTVFFGETFVSLLYLGPFSTLLPAGIFF